MHVSPFGLVRKRDVLHSAWRKVRENGLDSLSQETREQIFAFDANAPKALRRISDQLRQQQFEFIPQKGVAKKRKGKASRPLVVGAIENRVVQRAILDVLQEMPFIRSVLDTPTSIGGVPTRGRGHAVALVFLGMQQGAKFYLRSDIEGFFTKIPRQTVIDWIAPRVDDADFVELIERATETKLANIEQLGDDALLFPIGDHGVAQGCPLSPLMGNILLNEFDTEMNRRGVMCVRYIDDFIILGPRPSAVRKAFQSAQQMLRRLGLRAYDPAQGEDKAKFGAVTDGFDFLGCQISPGLVQPSRSARSKILVQCEDILAEARASIRLATKLEGSRTPKLRYAQTLDRLDRTLRGWAHAFAFCNARQSFQYIDGEMNYKLRQLRFFVSTLLSNAAPDTRRRVLGVHLLADTRLEPLPDVADLGRFGPKAPSNYSSRAGIKPVHADVKAGSATW